jgi:MFS family permease
MTTTSARHARWAVTAIFIAHGVLIGAWVPHIALAKERLAVGPATFGLALLAIAAGAVIAMPLAGVAINRFGSASVILVTGIAFCIAFFGPLSAQTLPLFLLAGLAMGAAIGSMDVAMNAHGIAVEKQLKLPAMSQFHGGFSLGGMAGAFAGAALLHRYGAMPQAITAFAACLAGMLAAACFLLPNSVDKGLSGSHFAWPTKATIGLGLLCFLALMVEGSILDWAAIMLREKFFVEASFAALAFGFYQGGMTVARFAGDWLRLKFGAIRLVWVSALMTAAGTTAALVAPTPWLATLAFIFAGLGIGNIAPILFAGGGSLEPGAPGRGIAAVTTLGYSGFLAGPALIGFAAELSTLPLALGITVLAALVIAVFARTVDAADTF